MNQKIVEVNCDISELEEFRGYTIDEVYGCIDASGEGFMIKAYRIVSGIKIYRDFRQEDGVCYISEEYIPNAESLKEK